MAFVKKFRTDFFIENNHIKLSKDYLNRTSHKFKKITGTRLASVLGMDAYRSPLKIWTVITNLYEEFIEPTFAEVGKIIESKILTYAREKLQHDYHSYDPVEHGWDLFKSNKYFGGIPDAEAENAPMLEIKTASLDDFCYRYDEHVKAFLLRKDSNGVPLVKDANGKYRKWHANGKIVVPKNYKVQLALYLYLRQQIEGMFVICFLKKEDYAFPHECDVSRREVIFEKMRLNLKIFDRYINDAKQWYEKYVLNGISPPMTDQDVKWFFDEIKSDYGK